MTCDTQTVPVPVITDTLHIMCPSKKIEMHPQSPIQNIQTFVTGFPLSQYSHSFLLLLTRNIHPQLFSFVESQKLLLHKNNFLSLITSTVTHQDYSDFCHRSLIITIFWLTFIFICSINKFS